MSDFHVVLTEGLFYLHNNSLCMEEDGGQHKRVAGILTPLVGQRVQLAVHHLPPQVDHGKPGLGSCCWLPLGAGCPVRHDLTPDRLLSFHAEGVLRDEPWRLEKFDGTVVTIPFSGMPGHYGRLAVASMPDLDQMRDILAKLDPASLAAAGVKAEDLGALLAKLRKAID